MNGNGPDDLEVVGIKRKRKKKVPIGTTNTEKERTYIFCRKRAKDKDGKLRYSEKRVNVEVCRRRSQGLVGREGTREYVEEECLGCTLWLDKLREMNGESKKKEKRKKKRVKRRR